MSVIDFDVSTQVYLQNGSNLKDIAFVLQGITDKHLYINDGLLWSAYDFNSVPIDKCQLIKYDKGYHLIEIITGCKYIVFSKELMTFLITKEEKDIVSYEEEDIVSYEEDIIPTFIDNPLTYQGDEDHIARFRMLLKPINDIDSIYTTYINPKIYKQLQKLEDIDLAETIKYSFNSFLQYNGYQSDVEIKYFEDVFAEVLIKTDKPISNTHIYDIENNAVLELEDSNLLYFQHSLQY